MATRHIAYACNDEYTIPMGVSLFSLFENNRDMRLCVHLYSDGISEENKEHCRKIAQDAGQQLVIEDMPDLNAAAGEELYLGQLPITTYLRIFLVTLLPPDVDKVLWIDGDTIISGKIEELFDEDKTELSSNACAAVFNLSTVFRRLHGFGIHDPYYNAGVLLINLAYWREHHVYDEIMAEIKRRHGKAIDHDQDLLNCVLKGRIKTLSPRFNFMPHYALACKDRALFLRYTKARECETYSAEELSDAKADVRIYHLITIFIERYSVRPWFSNGNHPFGELWHEYFAKTPWKDTPLPTYTGQIQKSAKELHPNAIVRLKQHINSTLVAHVPLVRKIVVRMKYGFWPR